MIPLEVLSPKPLVIVVISCGKYDQLMRPEVVAGMEFLCTRGGGNNRASHLRGAISFETLEVGVRHEVVLVDA